MNSQTQRNYINFLSERKILKFSNTNETDLCTNYLIKRNILTAGESSISGCKNFLRFTLGPVKYIKLITNALNKCK